MFKVEADFTSADLDRMIDGDVDQWFDDLVDGLRKAGRKLVDKARAKTKVEGGFNNITWNLRASIGMCLVDETGKIVETYFPPLGKGPHGVKVGTEQAQNLAIYARDINEMSMVFVAGEEYATFVQAKGKDVIKHVVGDNLPKAIREVLGA